MQCIRGFGVDLLYKFTFYLLTFLLTWDQSCWCCRHPPAERDDGVFMSASHLQHTASSSASSAYFLTSALPSIPFTHHHTAVCSQSVVNGNTSLLSSSAAAVVSNSASCSVTSSHLSQVFGSDFAETISSQMNIALLDTGTFCLKKYWCTNFLKMLVLLHNLIVYFCSYLWK